MKDLENKSNNDILLEIVQLKADHESLKNKMLKDWDELVKIEERFNAASAIVNKRLKGQPTTI